MVDSLLPSDTPSLIRTPMDIYAAVGAVAVHGGHVEFSMQRLLLRLRWADRGDLEFDIYAHRADVHAMMWSALTDKIGKHICQYPHHADVADRLERARSERLADLRNDVIHAYWWLDGTSGVRANRIPTRPRDGRSGWVIVGDIPDLFAIADKLSAFARDLEDLVPGPLWLTPSATSVPL